MLNTKTLIKVLTCVIQAEEQEIQVQVSGTTPPRSQLGSISNKSSPQQPPDVTDEESKEQLKRPSIYLDSSQHHKIIFDANVNDSGTMSVNQGAKQEDFCPLDEPIEQQAQSEYSEEVNTPEKEEQADISASSDSGDDKPQPWELVGDRYAPIRIEQVSSCMSDCIP